MTTTPTVSYNLVSAVKSCLKRYVQFSGRACRSEYWYWTLATIVLAFILAFVTGDFSNPEGESSLVSDLYSLAIFLPGLAVFVRRMHDIGRSGWNYLWNLFPSSAGLSFWCICASPPPPPMNTAKAPPLPRPDSTDTFCFSHGAPHSRCAVFFSCTLTGRLIFERRACHLRQLTLNILAKVRASGRLVRKPRP